MAALDEHARLATIDYRVGAGMTTMCFNHPEARNAIDRGSQQFLEVARRIADDRAVRARADLRGPGPSLSVGGDMTGLPSGSRPTTW